MNIENRHVSILCWPTQRKTCAVYGHVELEIDNFCYTLHSGKAECMATLDQRIQRVSRHNLPFFQFHLRLSEQEYYSLKNNIFVPISCVTCSHGVYEKLSKTIEFNEFPCAFSILPLTFTLALGATHQRDPSRIYRVSFHGNESLITNVRMASPGIVGECLFFSWLIFSGSLITILFCTDIYLSFQNARET